MSITSEIRLRVRKEGDVVLNQLSAKLNDVASRSTITSSKFKDLSATLRQTDAQIRTKSINGLNDYARAWRELANNVDITSKEFKEATREAQRFEQQVAKAQGRRAGGGRLAGMARTAGAVGAAGIFGGPEGAIGAGIGAVLGGGSMGAAVGGAIGAQVGGARQQLGATASYAAELQKQRVALAGLTTGYGEYRSALQQVERLSQQFQIPQEIITRQFTKLAASVIGAGGTLQDTEKAFKGVAAGVRGTGGDLQDLSSALIATSQVFSKGKVSAEELRQQIGERLPGAFTLFAKSLGMTPAELDKALEDGKVSLQDFQKFSELLFKKFGNSAEAIVNGPAAAGDRLQVQLSKLKENIGKLLAPIGAAFQNVFSGIIKLINQAAVGLNKLFKTDLSGEVENIQKQLDELVIPESGPQRQRALRTQANLRRDLAQGLRQRALLSIGEGDGTAPTGLPGIDLSTAGAKVKTKVVSKEIYDLELKRNLATREGNQLRIVQLDFEINRQKLMEELNAKKISQDVYEIELQKQGERLANNVARIEKDRVDAGLQYQTILNNLLFSTQNLSEKEKERIENNQKLVPLIEAGMAAVDAGKISMKEFLDALREVKKLMEGDGEKTFGQTFNETFQEGIKNMGELAQNLGNSLAKAFGGAADALADFITTGKASFKDFARSVLQDLARIFIRAAMFNALKGIFQGSGFLGFASGGIMSNDGAFPLKRYARGGIANSPQLAMFGEGSTPEAYVPLPDGRTIPVTMKNGGKGVGNVVVNVDATGSSAEGDSQQANKLGEAIGVAVRQELIRQKRPGGLLA